MDERERPNLTLRHLTHITDAHYEADQAAWEVLRPFLNPKEWSDTTRFNGPRPPKLTAKFYLILSNYSHELFQIEAREYPRYPPSPHFPDWLRNLARKVEDHVIAVVKDVEASDPDKGFLYHGVVEKEMRKNIRHSLHAVMESSYNVQYLASPLEVLVQILEPAARTAQPPSRTVKTASSELPSPPQTSRRTVIEPLLEARGWSILDWANEANVAHATAMDFLLDKTNPYRSTRLKLAKALDITVDQLPR